MGLCIQSESGGDISFSYGTFHMIRVDIAKQFWIDLNKMAWFWGEKSWEDIKSPIKYFLNHSDCEGTIWPKRAWLIAEELKKIKTGDDWTDKMILELADLFDGAFKNNDKIIFC